MLFVIFRGKFERGIKELPLIENTCFLITKEEFNNIHQFVDSEDKPIKIGVALVVKS
jgi:hypothetical protein